MLTSLLIKDYALIENVHIDMNKGLNIITGETGAGKSIILGALGLVLGERANTEIVRHGTKKAVVEGIFDVEGNTAVKEILEKNEIDTDAELIVRREVSLKGSNRCFLNDTPVTLNVIREIGNLLVDLHGQHEHQSLLRIDTHISMLDECGDVTKELTEFEDNRNELQKLLKQLKELIKKETALKDKQDLFEFQIQEIDAVSPEENEEEELETELKILENSEKLIAATSETYGLLYDNDISAYNQLVEARNRIAHLADIDASFHEKVEELDSALAIVDDIARFNRSYSDRVEHEPVRLDEIRERLGAFNLLKKKYGGSIDAVMTYRKEIGAEYDLAANFADKISELTEQIDSLREVTGKIAAVLTAKRKEIAESIKPQIEESLKYLGIPDANFVTHFEYEEAGRDDLDYVVINGKKYRFGLWGADLIEFYISTNKGETPKPLAKIASGGEISRIMLALKTILAKQDKLPLLVFDEIDTGVSGRIAQKVGNTMKKLSEHHQIIAITHLPQIAALADYHFLVEKGSKGERVVSSIRELTRDEQVNEVAKLLAGEELTSSSIESARELMGFN